MQKKGILGFRKNWWIDVVNGNETLILTENDDKMNRKRKAENGEDHALDERNED